MSRKIVGIGLCAAVVASVLAAIGYAQMKSKTEPATEIVPVKMAAVAPPTDESMTAFAASPDAVRAAAMNLVGTGGEKAITQFVREQSRGGKVKYGIEYTVDGKGWSADISPSGQVSDLEQEEPDDDGPDDDDDDDDDDDGEEDDD